MKFYLLLLVALLVRLIFYFLQPTQPYKTGDTFHIKETLNGEPKLISGRQVIMLRDIRIVTSIFPAYHFGDVLELTGQVKSCQLVCSAYFPRITALSRGTNNPWFHSAFIARDYFISTYRQLFTRPQADLMTGIVLGSLTLNQDFKNKLATVGLTHIIAASGMNVTLVAGFVLWLMNLLAWRRIYKVLLSSILIVFYSTITGFEPPIVRAVLMALFVFAAQVFGRQGSGWWGLGLAVYIMLWVSPALLTNVSFLLSFSSMAGQIFVSTIKVRLPILLQALVEITLQSGVAIVVTLPIVLVVFGKFSLIALFTNILVVWTVEPLMLLGALLGFVNIFFTDLAKYLSLATGLLLDYFLWVIDYFGKNSAYLVKVENVSLLSATGYYLLIFGMYFYFKGRYNRIEPQSRNTE